MIGSPEAKKLAEAWSRSGDPVFAELAGEAAKRISK